MTPSTAGGNPQYSEAAARLIDIAPDDTHFIALNREKIPAFSGSWKGGHDRDKVRKHITKGGLIGIEPASLHTPLGVVFVVDVDTDTAEERKAAARLLASTIGKPFAYIPSGKPHRVHAYYLTEVETPNGYWRYGETRCKDGYLTVHRPDLFVSAVLPHYLHAKPVDTAKLPPPDKKKDKDKGRNSTLHAEGIAAARQQDGAALLEAVDKARQCGLSDREVASTVTQVLKSKAAKSAGRRSDKNKLADADADLEIISGADEDDVPTSEPLLPGYYWLRKRESTIISAPEKAGKSTKAYTVAAKYVRAGGSALIVPERRQAAVRMLKAVMGDSRAWSVFPRRYRRTVNNILKAVDQMVARCPDKPLLVIIDPATSVVLDERGEERMADLLPCTMTAPHTRCTCRSRATSQSMMDSTTPPIA